MLRPRIKLVGERTDHLRLDQTGVRSEHLARRKLLEAGDQQLANRFAFAGLQLRRRITLVLLFRTILPKRIPNT